MLTTSTLTALSSLRCEQLAAEVQAVLDGHADRLPFHDWSHTAFVTSKAAEFAARRVADVEIVEAAALVHDLNYTVRTNSHPRAGKDIRQTPLASTGFTPMEVDRIEQIITAAHTADRLPDADLDTQCLSDADTLYKALPITPVLFAHRYLAESGIDLRELAEKLAEGFYFYDPDLRHRYEAWAEANLNLWRAVLDALDDGDVAWLAGAPLPALDDDDFRTYGCAAIGRLTGTSVVFVDPPGRAPFGRR
jgi:uncharacterized protein